jgi:DNA-binding CsgD family transcriptional regulator
LDAHREESPELIGSEAVEGLAADGATKISIARQLGIGEATVFSSPFFCAQI